MQESKRSLILTVGFYQRQCNTIIQFNISRDNCPLSPLGPKNKERKTSFLIHQTDSSVSEKAKGGGCNAAIQHNHMECTTQVLAWTLKLSKDELKYCNAAASRWHHHEWRQMEWVMQEKINQSKPRPMCQQKTLKKGKSVYLYKNHSITNHVL